MFLIVNITDKHNDSHLCYTTYVTVQQSGRRHGLGFVCCSRETHFLVPIFQNINNETPSMSQRTGNVYLIETMKQATIGGSVAFVLMISDAFD